MEYHESADYLQSLQRRRPKLGIDTTARMLSHLGDPQADIDCVQIAGSNGKGSTARLLEHVLRAAGLDVGLFTSPGLTDFREQIRVNGRQIPKSRVTAFVDRIDPCIERRRAADDEPTHFEVLTALALHHFGERDVDIAVLEVGIGGRYDATSAVDPVASAVTSVSLEHTALLGDSVEEIARDKAQVAPDDASLVTGATGPALDAIRAETDVVTVSQEGADVVAVETGMRSAVENEVSITGPDWALETTLTLLGQHQATNAGVAATLARHVADVGTGTIAEGLSRATWPGRFEIRSTEPMVVLDGSHNPGAMATLEDLLGRYDYDDLHVVFASMQDKEYEQMIAALPPVETAFPTRPSTDRAAAPDALAAAFAGAAETVRPTESVPEATEQAIAAADETDFVLVTGSLYAVAEARDRWTRQVVPTDRVPRSRGADSVGDTTSDGSNPVAGDGGTAGTQQALNGGIGGSGNTMQTPETVHRRTFSTTLRPDQAAILDQRLDALGGTCVRSPDDAPEQYVRTHIAGSPAQLRALISDLHAAGQGLSRVAVQLERVLDGPGPTGPEAIAGDGTAVMGVLNVTPDSFYDGGEYDCHDAAVERATEMVAAGADILDVGGESTRPGADPVSVTEEIDRVIPVVESLSSLDVPVSVDTRKAAVADAALAAGAEIVNDVSGLSDPEMRFVVADHNASLILMHSLSAPVDPDRTATYDDVVADVRRELTEQVLHAEQAGIDRDRIIVDPGCGFGKDGTESFALVDRLAEFRALGCPVMLGHSRKSMFERVDCGSGARLPPTLAVTAMAAERGADVVRVHDVAENAAVVRTVGATVDR